VLDQIVRERGAGPELVRMDNGPEMTANALRDWCRFTGAERSFIEPGSPWQNAFAESFGSRVRDEVSSVEAFDSVIEAHTVINDWKDIYNHQRPHSSHGWRTPAALAATVTRRSPAQPTPTLIAAAGPTNGARHPAHCSTSQRLKELLGQRSRQCGRPRARRNIIAGRALQDRLVIAGSAVDIGETALRL
jgi:hypothetical protein